MSRNAEALALIRARAGDAPVKSGKPASGSGGKSASATKVAERSWKSTARRKVPPSASRGDRPTNQGLCP